MGRPLRGAAGCRVARVRFVVRRRSGARTVRRACSHAHVERCAAAASSTTRTAAGLHAALEAVAARSSRYVCGRCARRAARKTCTVRSTRACASLCRRRRAHGCMPGAAATIRSRRRSLLYARDRAAAGARRGARDRARICSARAPKSSTPARCLPATTHWQPAQPVLLAFWLQPRPNRSCARRARLRALRPSARIVSARLGRVGGLDACRWIATRPRHVRLRCARRATRWTRRHARRRARRVAAVRARCVDASRVERRAGRVVRRRHSATCAWATRRRPARV